MMWIDNRKNKMTTFENIKEGEVFMYDDTLYMKTAEICGDYNAVTLENGEPDYFGDNDTLEKVEVRLEIVG